MFIFFLNSYPKILIATYGARVRGSVFKMEFRVQLENLNPLRPFQDLPGFQGKIEFECWKKYVKRQKSKSERCEFYEKICVARFLTRKTTGNGMNQNPEN